MTRMRAAAGLTGSCALVLIFAGLAGSDLILSAAIAGEAEDSEVSIGTFEVRPHPETVRSDVRALTDSVAREAVSDTSERAKAPATSAMTRQLYDEAVSALNNGRRDDAQRLFERLIVEAPESAAAGAARGHLATLYGAAANKAPANAQKTAEISQLGDPNRARGIAVSEALEERFIVEAGDRVFFSVGSAELGARARGVLRAQAKFIKLRPELAATIEGHADDAPLSAEEHGKLSAARSEAVRQRLMEEGVESDRLAVVSWGRDKRVAECPDAGCAAQNRRAVTLLYTVRPRNTNGPAGLAPGAAAVVSSEPDLLTH